MNYLVVTIKDWNIKLFKEKISKFPGKWHLITNPEDLNLENLAKIQPRYIFFPHWSQIVPTKILNTYECVCFHETDLPYGRGGSPIQNLIIEGKTESKLSALRMIDKLDAGPIYMKKAISLKGRAQEIYEKNALVVVEMINEIITKNPQPKEQLGKTVNFKRRKPEQSDLKEFKAKNIEEFHNFIRMLDAETYPKAFLKMGKFRLEFFDAEKKGDKLTAQVTISAEVLTKKHGSKK